MESGGKLLTNLLLSCQRAAGQDFHKIAADSGEERGKEENRHKRSLKLSNDLFMV